MVISQAYQCNKNFDYYCCDLKIYYNIRLYKYFYVINTFDDLLYYFSAKQKPMTYAEMYLHELSMHV